MRRITTVLSVLQKWICCAESNTTTVLLCGTISTHEIKIARLLACRPVAGGVAPYYRFHLNRHIITYIFFANALPLQENIQWIMRELYFELFKNFTSTSTIQPMDIFDTRYFRINKMLLSLTGLWPMQSTIKKKSLFCCAILGMLIILLPQVPHQEIIVHVLENHKRI